MISMIIYQRQTIRQVCPEGWEMNFLRVNGFYLGESFDPSSFLAIENNLWESFGHYSSEYSGPALSFIDDFSCVFR